MDTTPKTARRPGPKKTAPTTSHRPLIVFDIGNVLIRFYFSMARRNFDRLHRGMGEKVIRYLWFSPLARPLETGRLTDKEIYRRVKNKFGLKISYDQFCWAFNNIFIPVRENLRLFRELGRRYPTALLSNTNPIHWAHVLKRFPALRRAKWPFSSHHLGLMKPDPRIYRLFSRKTGVPLDRMIYVDDRPENVEAGRRLGMKAIRFTGRRPLKKDLREVLARFSANGANHN